MVVAAVEAVEGEELPEKACLKCVLKHLLNAKTFIMESIQFGNNIDVEIEEFREHIIKALNTYEKEGAISLLFFAELLGIGSNDAYTMWKPSSQLVIRLNNPFTSIETLSLFFNKNNSTYKFVF